MTSNSHLFDSIRIKSTRKNAAAAPKADAAQPCAHPGCGKPGPHRAPMGRDREGQFFCFCLDHVREYNATYNYFNGMSDEAVAKYQKEALVGHRPTWNMGVNRAGRDRGDDGPAENDPLGMFNNQYGRNAPAPRRPSHSAATLKALAALELDESA